MRCTVSARPSMRRLALPLAVCLLVARVAAAQALPPNFSDITVFSGLTSPTVVKFASDGRVFVAEKSGLIKVFASLTATTPTIFADLRTQVQDYWDRGLLGLELDRSEERRVGKECRLRWSAAGDKEDKER